jgi:hypothetical protein
MLSLDLVHTVAFSGIVLFVGYGLCRLIRPLSPYPLAFTPVRGSQRLGDPDGWAPRAFLVVPMVGAFFIDFTNAFLITVCLNILK